MSSITPLNITDELIDPLNNSIIQVLNATQLRGPSSVNRYDTRPNDVGLINEDSSHVKKGMGHRIQIARTGHCEILECLEWDVSPVEDNKGVGVSNSRTFTYSVRAGSLHKQITALKTVWDAALPFHDALLTTFITNTSNIRLYARPTAIRRSDRYGPLVEAPYLGYSSVVNKKASINDMTEVFAKRLVNYFGLVLDKLYDDDSKFAWPDFLVK